MPPRWVTCPRCQVVFQSDSVGTIRCTACATDFSAPPPQPPSTGFYVALNKQKIGPLSLPDLQQMSRAGKLQPDDMVLQEGARQWLPARSVAGLFATATV